MKKKFNFLIVAAFLAVGLIGCSDEEAVGPNQNGKTGPETYSSLTVKDAALTPAMYGTTDTDEPAANEGLGSANSLKAYIYNTDVSAAPTNILAYNPSTDNAIKFTGTEAGIYKSNKFKLASGNKYIYVFAEQKTQDPTIVQKGSNVAYELQTIKAGFTNSSEKVAETAAPNGSDVYRVNPLPENIATSNAFLIGTLWGKQTKINSGGTEDTPVNIAGLTIGRLASKVNLTEVVQGTETPLKGSFETGTATYRMCSVPDAMYLVGQWDGTNEPGTNAAAPLVKSIYHDEVYGTEGNQNTKFRNYKWDGAYKLNNAYYTVENTTSLQGDLKEQYYGNSTYIQLKIKYIPNPATPIYDADGNDGATLDTDGTFWLFTVEGEERIFAEQPSEGIKGISSKGTKYDKGFMYYSFPVADNSEDDLVKRYTVLRNHSYLVKVTGIKNFGSGSDAEVTPETPIVQETWVTLEVQVLPWSKIVQEVPL